MTEMGCKSPGRARLIMPNSIGLSNIPAILTNTINPVHIRPLEIEHMSLDTALPQDIAMCG